MTIVELAGRMLQARDEARPFALLLGAGASVESGVWTNQQIIEDVLNLFREDIREGETKLKNLREIWSNRPAFRFDFEKRYFEGKSPSIGYRSLSRLIRDGFVRPVLSLNFDTLLEKSLQEIQCQPLVLTRVGLNAEKIRQSLRDRRPVLLKLHVANELEDFLWMAGQTVTFESIEPKLTELLAGDLIVCGYSFFDSDVNRVLCGNEVGRSRVYYVNPFGWDGASAQPIDALRGHRETELVRLSFDSFFTQLEDAVTECEVLASYPTPISTAWKRVQQAVDAEEETRGLKLATETAIRLIWSAIQDEARSRQPGGPTREELAKAQQAALQDASLDNVVAVIDEIVLTGLRIEASNPSLSIAKAWHDNRGSIGRWMHLCSSVLDTKDLRHEVLEGIRAFKVLGGYQLIAVAPQVRFYVRLAGATIALNVVDANVRPELLLIGNGTCADLFPAMIVEFRHEAGQARLEFLFYRRPIANGDFEYIESSGETSVHRFSEDPWQTRRILAHPVPTTEMPRPSVEASPARELAGLANALSGSAPVGDTASAVPHTAQVQDSAELLAFLTNLFDGRSRDDVEASLEALLREAPSGQSTAEYARYAQTLLQGREIAEVRSILKGTSVGGVLQLCFPPEQSSFKVAPTNETCATPPEQAADSISSDTSEERTPLPRLDSEASAEFLTFLTSLLEGRDREEIQALLRTVPFETSVGLSAVAADAKILRCFQARFSLLYLLSYEEDRVIQALIRICKGADVPLYSWSFHQGLKLEAGTGRTERVENPGEAVEWCVRQDRDAVYVLKDFHPFLTDAAVIRRIRDAVREFRGKKRCLVFLSPTYVVPTELERDVTVMAYPLPELEEFSCQLSSLVEQTGSREEYLSAEEGILDKWTQEWLSLTRRVKLLEACSGLTLTESGNLFARALAREGTITRDTIAELLREKEQLIRKSGFLDFITEVKGFEDIGGVSNLKSWIAARQVSDNPLWAALAPPPKGVLLVGVPGCGKSICARAIAAAWQRPLLRLDLGRVFGGLVGETEANMRRSLSVAEAAAPCVLWVDEIERGFAGAWGGNTGVSSRILGAFLSWMQEKESNVFVAATANNLDELPPEFVRKGRFDEIFFLDFPAEDDRAEIFRIHLESRGYSPVAFPVSDYARASQWLSGAEIEQVVISALERSFAEGRALAAADIHQELTESTSIGRTAWEEIEALRSRAMRLGARTAGTLGSVALRG